MFGNCLFHEKANIFDDEDDGEVDLASYAFQIWKNATDADPRWMIVKHYGWRIPIFSAFPNVLSIEPAEAVFLDDIGRNLKIARELGMKTIKVDQPEEALEELSTLLGFQAAVDHFLDCVESRAEPRGSAASLLCVHELMNEIFAAAGIEQL